MQRGPVPHLTTTPPTPTVLCGVETVCKPNYTANGCIQSPQLPQHTRPKCVVDMLYMVCTPLRGSTAWPLLQRDSLLLLRICTQPFRQ
jgi:hypothetical protein